MNISEYKYRITLQPPTIKSGEFGNAQIITYTGGTEINCWAKKIDIGGNKLIQNFELFASHILQFCIRYRTDFNETWRIKHNNRFYTIMNIKESEYHKELTITAELQQLN